MGHADKLIEHIQTEIEPYLKKNYRVQDYRLAIGHSLGATFITYASMKTDNLFDYNILKFSHIDLNAIERGVPFSI
jgi:predicted alpha/beta superfamily hydrolase